jgi:hypothetical protein
MRREKFKKAKDWYNTGKTIKEMQVRTEPCDLANTVLKMGDKRALVGGVLLILGASEFFTCDVEDMPREYIDTTGEIIQQTETNHSPQRKSTAAVLTPEQIEAKAAEAKARLHAEDGPKNETKPASEATKAPADGVNTAKGIITNVGAPNGGGYVSIAVEGYQRDDSRDKLFSTKDEKILDAISDHVADNTPIEFRYTDNANPRFASSIVELIA